MATAVQCPLCDFKAAPSEFRTFEVGLAKQVKADGTSVAPAKAVLSVCPKCGVAFKPG